MRRILSRTGGVDDDRTFITSNGVWWSVESPTAMSAGEEVDVFDLGERPGIEGCIVPEGSMTGLSGMVGML